MNKVSLIGRMAKDAELKYTPNTGTAVASFSIAVERRVKNKNGEKEADFIIIVVFGKQAENVATYTVKGRLIAIVGRLQNRSYDAKDGTKRYITEVVAEEVQFIEWAKKPSGELSNELGQDITPVDDGEIPFD